MPPASSLRALRPGGAPAWLLLALAAAAVLVTGLFLPLTDGVTAFYGAVAKNILLTGDWITLHASSMPVVDKPPLTFWLMSLSFRLFGTSEAALRAWHLALSLGTAGAVYALARLDLPRREAWAAAAILLTTLQFFYQSLVPEQHVPLALFLTLAVYWQLRWERGGLWWAAMLTWLSAALAVLTIGIAGAAMAVLVTGAHLLVDRPRLPAGARRTALLGATLFTATAAPWFIVGIARQGRAFAETFFLGGTLGVSRFFHQVQSSPTVVPWWAGFGAYALLLPLGVLPWTGWLWAGLREGWAARRRGPAVLWTCTLWTVVVVVFLSAALGDKSSRYLLPVFPPVAVLLGHAVVDGRWAKGAATVSLAAALPLLALVAAVAIAKFPGDTAQYAPVVWHFLPLFASGLTAYAAAVFLRRPGTGLACVALATLLAYQLAIDAAGRIWDRVAPWRPLAAAVNASGVPDARVLMLGADNAWIDYYVSRPVQHVDPAQLRQAWARERVVVIIPAAALAALPSAPPARRIGPAVAGFAIVANAASESR